MEKISIETINNNQECKLFQSEQQNCYICEHRKKNPIKENKIYSEEKYKEILRKNKVIYARKVTALEKELERYKFLYEEEQIRSSNLELLLEDKRNIIEELQNENLHYKGEIAGHANAISIFSSDLYSKLMSNFASGKTTSNYKVQKENSESDLTNFGTSLKSIEPIIKKSSKNSKSETKPVISFVHDETGPGLKPKTNFEEISETEDNDENVENKLQKDKSNDLIFHEIKEDTISEQEEIVEKMDDTDEKSEKKVKHSVGSEINVNANYYFNGGKSEAELEKKMRKKKNKK